MVSPSGAESVRNRFFTRLRLRISDIYRYCIMETLFFSSPSWEMKINCLQPEPKNKKINSLRQRWLLHNHGNYAAHLVSLLVLLDTLWMDEGLATVGIAAQNTHSGSGMVTVLLSGNVYGFGTALRKRVRYWYWYST